MMTKVNRKPFASWKKNTILIADDAPLMRTMLKDVIKTNGLATEIFEATNGDDAIKKYLLHKPNLVIMDVIMPKTNGIEALQQIKKIDPKAKVLMISSSDEKINVQDAMTLGAIDYIVKPIDRSSLALSINRALRRN